MKSFVTGASGFLGSHLVDLLLQEGHEVRCLVRKSSDRRWLKNKPLQLVEGNLQPGDAGLGKGLVGVDWCFHVAGVITTTKPQEYFQINVGGTRHCLDTCLQIAPNLKRFVLVSSIAACGPSQNGSKIDEQTPAHPLTLYGQSKLEAEKLALSYRDKLPIAILRPPAIYGARDKMIYPVFKLAKKGFFFVPRGEPRTISMAYVEDVARSCLWAASEPKAKGEIYFIADDDCYTWQDIADCLATIFYRSVKKIPVPKSLLWSLAFLEESRAKFLRGAPRMNRGHVAQFFRHWGIGIDKIKQAGFTPQFNLEAGMQTTVAGYRQLGWL